MTPPDCDLRGLSYMPLDVQRLRDSDLALVSTGDEFKAAVTLWCVSWTQVPAASLPDDDHKLAALARVDAKTWRKVKDMALHNWVKCSDGRLYHAVIAEKACEAWADRIKYRDKRDKDAERLRLWRESQKLPPELPRNGDGNKSETRFDTRFETQPEEKGTWSEVEGINGGVCAQARDAISDDWPSGNPAAMVVQAVNSPWLDPMKSHGLVTTAGYLEAWRRAGAVWARDVIPVVTGVCAGRREPIGTWKFFDSAIRRAISENGRVLEIADPATVLPFRGGVFPSITDRIGADNDEARRRTLAMLDEQEAKNGR